MINTSLESVITCLEHEKLLRTDFTVAEDFYYLLEAELPCFAIIYKNSEPQLLVKQYLAKIVLPSGTSLEILPKITANQALNITTLKHVKTSNTFVQSEHQVNYARYWVAQMLSDLAEYNIKKIIGAYELADYISAEIDINRPWYEWLLNLASQKIADAEHLIPNKYQTQVQNHPKAKGKLNLSAQLKENWHRPHYLHTKQTFLDTDGLMAQFLATGWQNIQNLHPAQTISVHTPHNQVCFKGTKTLVRGQWLSSYKKLLNSLKSLHSQLTPAQSDILRQALAWCWWVLQKLLEQDEYKSERNGTHSALKQPIPAIMFNMNDAFEKWVLGRLKIWVKQNLPNSQLIVQMNFDWLKVEDGSKQENMENDRQASKLLSKQVVQGLVPDACIKTLSGQITHVIDIKYKNIDSIGDVSGADWQQLAVYQNYFDAVEAWLIFPMTKGFAHKICVDNMTYSDTKHDNVKNDICYSHKGDIDTIITNSKMSIVPFDLLRKQIVDK